MIIDKNGLKRAFDCLAEGTRMDGTPLRLSAANASSQKCVTDYCIVYGGLGGHITAERAAEAHARYGAKS